MNLDETDRQWLTTTLSQVDFLVYHSADEISLILERIEKIICEPGTVIVQQGQERSDFLIIGAGRVSVWVEKAGQRQLIAELGPGQYVGEMSLLTNSRCNADVVAEEQTALFRVDQQTFYAIIQKNLTLADHIARVVAERRADRQARFGVEENVDREEQYRRVKDTLLKLIDG